MLYFPNLSDVKSTVLSFFTWFCTDSLHNYHQTTQIDVLYSIWNCGVGVLRGADRSRQCMVASRVTDEVLPGGAPGTGHLPSWPARLSYWTQIVYFVRRWRNNGPWRRLTRRLTG